MATSAATLIQRVRRYVRDYPAVDATSASISSSGTTLVVSSTASPAYHKNGRIDLDYETLVVDVVVNATDLTVFRGSIGSTAASHASGTVVLLHPRFHAVEILDLLNQGLDNLWPYFYQEVVDTSLSGGGGTYEFTIPVVTSIGSLPLPRLYRVEIRHPGRTDYLDNRRWEIIRGGTPK